MNDNIRQINYIIIFFIFFFSNLIFHFLPFERASVAPDDISFLLKKFEGLRNLINYNDRPFQYLYADIQNILINDNSFLGLCLIFVSNLFLSFVLFFFSQLFFKNSTKSILVVLIFILLPQKNEIYHAPIYSHIIISTSIYLISLIFLINFMKNKTYYNFISFIIFYTIGIFWYEIGFFIFLLLPILLVYEDKKNILKFKSFILITFLIFIFYFFYRITGVFGFADNNFAREIKISNFVTGIYQFFNVLTGLNFIKISFYGLISFVKIENYFLLFFFIFTNIIISYAIYVKFKSSNFIKFNNYKLFLLIIIFIIFIIPNVLSGGSAGRNIIVPLMVTSIFIVYFISNFFKSRFSLFLIPVIFITAIINQGININQINASLIHGDIHNFIKNNKINIANSKNILFDTSSFKKNIIYTYYERDYNQFNYYFSSQLIETYGIEAMIIIEDKTKNWVDIYFAHDNLNLTNNNYSFDFYNNKGLNKVELSNQELPIRSTFLINYNKVYPNGFYKKY